MLYRVSWIVYPMARRLRKDMAAVSGKVIAIVVVVIIVVAAAGVLAYEFYKPSNKTVITLNWSLAGSEKNYSQDHVITAFEQAYPNITVKTTDLSATDVISTLLSQKQAGKISINVVEEDNSEMGALVSQNLVMPLNPYLGQLEAMTGGSTGYTANGTIIPAYYHEGLFNGSYYFFPYRGNVQLAYFNQSALTSVGATTLPDNTTNLQNDMQLLKNNGYAAPFNMQGHGGASTPTQVFQWMAEFNGNPMVLNDSGDIAALTYLQQLNQKGLMSPEYSTSYWATYTGLAAGSYQYIPQWPYVTSALEGLGMQNYTYVGTKANTYDLGIMPVFKGPDNTAQYIVGGDVLGVVQGSSNVWASLDLINFLNTLTVQRGLLLNLSWPVVNEQAYNNLPSNISYLFNFFKYEEQNGIFRPAVPWLNQWQTVFNTAWTSIMASNGNITTALNAAHQSMVTYLQQNYPNQVTAYNNNQIYPSGNYIGPHS